METKTYMRLYKISGKLYEEIRAGKNSLFVTTITEDIEAPDIATAINIFRDHFPGFMFWSGVPLGRIMPVEE